VALLPPLFLSLFVFNSIVSLVGLFFCNKISVGALLPLLFAQKKNETNHRPPQMRRSRETHRSAGRRHRRQQSWWTVTLGGLNSEDDKAWGGSGAPAGAPAGRGCGLRCSSSLVAAQLKKERESAGSKPRTHAPGGGVIIIKGKIGDIISFAPQLYISTKK
jgi:hypothetical protein